LIPLRKPLDEPLLDVEVVCAAWLVEVVEAMGVGVGVGVRVVEAL
jgi:hypothetical protein